MSSTQPTSTLPPFVNGAQGENPNKQVIQNQFFINYYNNVNM